MKRSELKRLIKEVIEEMSPEMETTPEVSRSASYTDAVLKNTNASMTENQFYLEAYKNVVQWYAKNNYGGDVKKATKVVNNKVDFDEDFWGEINSIFSEKYGHPPKKG